VKKLALNPSSDEIPKDLEFRKDRDVVGFLPRDQWSCLALDFLDKAAPLAGSAGMNFYYYAAKTIEAANQNYNLSAIPSILKMKRQDTIKVEENERREIGRKAYRLWADVLSKKFT